MYNTAAYSWLTNHRGKVIHFGILEVLEYRAHFVIAVVTEGGKRYVSHIPLDMVKIHR